MAEPAVATVSDQTRFQTPSVTEGHTGRIHRHLRRRAERVTPGCVHRLRPAAGTTAISSLTLVGLVAFASFCTTSRASAQEVRRSDAAATHTTEAPASADPVESGPRRKQFAFTVNPLNYLILRYGFNFEYQPVAHHGLIVSPHFESLSGNPSDDCSDTKCKITLRGGGVELGYRFYTGSQGFNGLFVSPSLVLAAYDVDSVHYGSNSHRTYTSIGAALDVGGQWQTGHFVLGGGIGVQYKEFLGERFGVPERGLEAIFMQYNASDEFHLRVLMSIGYAF